MKLYKSYDILNNRWAVLRRKTHVHPPIFLSCRVPEDTVARKAPTNGVPPPASRIAWRASRSVGHRPSLRSAMCKESHLAPGDHWNWNPFSGRYSGVEEEQHVLFVAFQVLWKPSRLHKLGQVCGEYPWDDLWVLASWPRHLSALAFLQWRKFLYCTSPR